MTSCKALLGILASLIYPRKFLKYSKRTVGFGAMETWIQILTLVQLGTNYLICFEPQALKCRMQILRSPIECIHSV